MINQTQNVTLQDWNSVNPLKKSRPLNAVDILDSKQSNKLLERLGTQQEYKYINASKGVRPILLTKNSDKKLVASMLERFINITKNTFRFIR